jgi:4-amino-4-deoxy-L-arabinose transferase
VTGACRARTLACAFAAVPLLIGLASPSDLDLYDQARQALYVVDAVDGGHWLAPRDPQRITTKPPLYTWLAAASAGALGMNEFAVQLPSRLAWLGLAAATFALGAELLGGLAGVLAVGLLAALEPTLKLANLVRTDMLLAFWIALAMLGCARGAACSFWLASAAAALTKGPVGLAIPLLAVALDAALRRDASRLRALRPALGLPLALLVFGAWLAAALRGAGGELWQVLVRTEFLQRLSGGGPFASLRKPAWYLLPYLVGKILPVSLFAPLALARDGWPTAGPARSLLFAWLAAGVAVVSLPATKRPDHLYPVYPAVALLAGGVLAHWASRSGRTPLERALAAGVTAWCAAVALATAAICAALAASLLPSLPRPPRAVLLAGPAALAALAIAVRPSSSRIERVACALAAQIAFLCLFQHVFTPVAREQASAQVRGFAREVTRAAGDEPLVFQGVDVHSVKFWLRRNAEDIGCAGVGRLAQQSGPHWLVASGAARAQCAATSAFEIAARSGPLRSFHGDELQLVRLADR